MVGSFVISWFRITWPSPLFFLFSFSLSPFLPPSFFVSLFLPFQWLGFGVWSGMVPWCPVASYSLWSLLVSLPINPICSLNKAFPLRLINEISKTLPRGHWSTIPLAYSSWRGTGSGRDGWVEIYKLHCICGCLCLCLSLFFLSRNKELPSIDWEV